MFQPTISAATATNLSTALSRQSLWLSNRPVRLFSIGRFDICARCRPISCPRGARGADICVACELQVCPRFR